MSTDGAGPTGILAMDSASLMARLRSLDRVSSTEHARDKYPRLRKQ
jgi:hypothetical protein